VKSILRIPIPPEKWGDWHVGKAGDHTILSAQRPRFPGVRDDQQFIAKIDRPNPDSDLSMQRIYHYRVGKGADKSLPKWAGESVDFLFAYGPSISKGMLVAGLIISAVDVVSAYQQGERQGDIALTREVFSWGRCTRRCGAGCNNWNHDAPWSRDSGRRYCRWSGGRGWWGSLR